MADGRGVGLARAISRMQKHWAWCRDLVLSGGGVPGGGVGYSIIMTKPNICLVHIREHNEVLLQRASLESGH